MVVNLRNSNHNLPIKKIHARRGKSLRAEPVVGLYEQGRIKHISTDLCELEDQMTSWLPTDKKKSPDRIDALVYGVTELILSNKNSRIHAL